VSSNAQKIKERLSIEDVIAPYVKLISAGSNLKGRCPFHNEKTPSFFVSPDRGTYYCFGCGAKGDIFSFVEQIDGLDFLGALNLLATRAGIKLSYEPAGGESKNGRTDLYKVMDEAGRFYEDRLKRFTSGLEYLKKRGLKTETISDFRIGYAPDDWRELLDYLTKKSFGVEVLKQAGLVKESEGRVYDTFRGRLMFPIFDTSGRIVAFSGRIFADDGKSAKYVNSPETAIFSKSKILFGFDRARQKIRTSGYSILVEGQVDLVMAHQSGFTNTVASSGTALTDEQLTLLNRFSPKIIMAFDSDGAGYRASHRSAQLALSRGFDVKIANLPEGEDPASLIQKNPKDWQDVIAGSQPIIEFAVSRVLKQKESSRVRLLKEEVLPYVAFLESSIERSKAVSLVATKLKVSEKSVWEDLLKVKQFEDRAIVSEGKRSGQNLSRKSYIGKRLLGIIFWQKSLAEPVLDLKTIEEELESVLGKEKFKEIFEFYESKASDLAFQTEVAYADTPEVLKEEVKELLLEFKKESLQESLGRAMIKLKSAEISGDKIQAEELLRLCQELSVKLKQ